MDRDEATVQELIDGTGHKQSNVSKHLGVLARAGLVARRKDGQKAYYRIDDPNLSAVCLLVCGAIDSANR
jgi:ArsR family transcriptional regulator